MARSCNGLARYVDLTPNNLPAAPVLTVEVLSASTALNDLNKTT
jgi:Uma2 family endonuclease